MRIFIIQKNFASKMNNDTSNRDVKRCLSELYDELFAHDGYGELRVEIRLLKRGQKEVIIHCGKQHRFVVPYQGDSRASLGA